MSIRIAFCEYRGVGTGLPNLRISNLRTCFLFLILILSSLLFPDAARAESADINAASRSVVRVAVFSEIDGERKMVGHASGLVVAPGKIITNAHVVEESLYNPAMTFQIIPSQGRESYMATVIKWSPDNDLALLQLEQGARLSPASLFSGPVEDGSDVFAIGYPANVDIAMQYDEADTLRPQPPVKTRGTISAGRSAKAFDTLLHTAPIGPGNSGGPILDSCGRVVGINSFGSTAENGGSEFYFAVTMKETMAFLRAQKVAFNSVSGPCRSVAELSREEAEREAAARAKIEEEKRITDDALANKARKVRRDMEYAIIAERDDRMAFAGLLLLLALGGVGASYALFDKGKRVAAKIAAIGAVSLAVFAVFAFSGRPNFGEIDTRLKPSSGAAATESNAPAVSTAEGKKVCVIQLDRSRVTVSNSADVTFDWKASGCVNGRTQYAGSDGEWTRSFVPNEDAQVSVIRYRPDSKIYRIERYLLGFDAMRKARDARNRYAVNRCSNVAAVVGQVGDMNAAISAVLPAQPNEVLVFNCSDAK
jgi:serine protease Do